MEDYNPFTDPAILEHQTSRGPGSTSTTTANVPTQSSYSAYVVGNNEPSAQYVMPSAKPSTNTTSSSQ